MTDSTDSPDEPEPFFTNEPVDPDAFNMASPKLPMHELLAMGRTISDEDKVIARGQLREYIPLHLTALRDIINRAEVHFTEDRFVDGLDWLEFCCEGMARLTQVVVPLFSDEEVAKVHDETLAGERGYAEDDDRDPTTILQNLQPHEPGQPMDMLRDREHAALVIDPQIENGEICEDCGGYHPVLWVDDEICTPQEFLIRQDIPEHVKTMLAQLLNAGNTVHLYPPGLVNERLDNDSTGAFDGIRTMEDLLNMKNDKRNGEPPDASM